MTSSLETIPAGYKQTEVGFIPENWEPCELEEISQFITKGATPTTYGFKWQQSGITFLRSECVSRNGLDLSQSMYISQNANEFMKRSKIASGDILMTITGNVGRVVIYDLPEPANINQHIAKIRIISDKADPLFVFHYLSSPKVRELFTTTTTGQAYPQTSLTQVRSAKIYLPDYNEQVKISRVLSDTDSLIQSLEQLIGKKRNIKKGTMQALLTRKIRLPGFSGEWDSIGLGEIAIIERGKMITKNETVQGEIPVIAGGMEPAYFHNVSNRSGKTITISGSGANAGYVSFHKGPIFASDCSTINESSGYSIEFIFFMLQNMQNQIYAEQTGGAQPHIYPSNLNKIQMYIPSGIPEQEAIAEVLSDMDVEITALEQRLVKTKEIKQGMMQQLLTGRIRLVNSSTSVEASA
jgi:type I restriction enzyme S subunit